MVREVVHNQQMVLIHTTPGAATVVARLLDRNANPEIMGAVAGNDVVLVARATSAAPVRPMPPWCAPWPKPAKPSPRRDRGDQKVAFLLPLICAKVVHPYPPSPHHGLNRDESAIKNGSQWLPFSVFSSLWIRALHPGSGRPRSARSAGRAAEPPISASVHKAPWQSPGHP